MSNVIDLPVVTSLDHDPARILAKACDEKFKSVVIVGVTEDGEEYFASSAADGADVLWYLERAKLKLLQVPDRE